MKKILVLMLLIFSFQVQSQFMVITSAQANAVAGGINVILATATGHGAGFINHSHTVTGNVIELNVCYWYDNTLPILYFNHEFFIPLSTAGTYTVNVNVMMSQSTEVCDNSANPANASFQTDYLSSSYNLWSNSVQVYPNPSSGIVYFDGLDAKISRVEVFAISGKRVKFQDYFADNKLNINDLQDGVYLVKVATEKGVLHKKIILKR